MDNGFSILMLIFGAAVMLYAAILSSRNYKFLPLTGITLPFVSYGGSSMVSSFILLAMLLSLTKEQRNV